MGNRPGMLLKSSDAKTLNFNFDPSCGINAAKETHLNSMTLSFDGPDTLTASCRAVIDGKEIPEQPTTLTRLK